MAIRRMLENIIHFRYKFCSGRVPCWILGDRKLGKSSRQRFLVSVFAKLTNKPYEIINNSLRADKRLEKVSTISGRIFRKIAAVLYDFQ